MGRATERNPDGRSRDEAPTVSVICTAKNAASTIGATIQSVQAQDFGDWEMIVVDDGSSDDTASIVRDFASSDARIRLVATEGVGRGRALNLALAEARADLVANIDADDESHPHRLRCQVEAMRRHPEFAIISTDWIRIHEDGQVNWPELDESGGEVVEVTRKLAFYNPVYHSSVMMLRTTALALGGYSEERTSKFDYDLCVRVAANGLALGRIPLPLVAQRLHSGQAYLQKRKFAHLLASLEVQIRAMRVLQVQRWYLPLIVLRFLWGILPVSLRIRLRNPGRLRRTPMG